MSRRGYLSIVHRAAQLDIEADETLADDRFVAVAEALRDYAIAPESMRSVYGWKLRRAGNLYDLFDPNCGRLTPHCS